ncbi:YHYH protein [Roseibium sp.]|uniref:YHYH protein n=1 Tax=Roseibium sp. TaxID=1936156 RepID=UPI003BAF0993
MIVSRPSGNLACAGLLAACLIPSDVSAHDAPSLSIPPDASAVLKTFLAHVRPEAIMQDAEVADCTLSGGTTTRCVKLVLKQAPREEPGPWCPSTIEDGPDDAGIWFKDGKVYDADGAFVKNLAEFYDDPKWQMYDPKTGDVLVSRSFDACFGVARPDVWKEYYYYCAQCTPEQTVFSPIRTLFIPLEPVPVDEPIELTDHPGAGVSLDGVRFEGPAPVNAILHAYNIAPFDDCGGHVNPYFGYHYHFATECLEAVEQSGGHADLVGMAMDGHGIYSQLDADGQEPQDLDACRGHTTAGLGYHYHAAPLGVNRVIGCFKAELGCALSPGSQTCDARLPLEPVEVPLPPPGSIPPE